MEKKPAKKKNIKSVLISTKVKGFLKNPIKEDPLKFYMSHYHNSKTAFVVAKFEDLSLQSEDYSTLLEQRYLSNFLIEFVINLILKDDVAKEYQLIISEVGTSIFCLQNSSYINLFNILSSSKYIIIPINVNSNHWCIIFLELEKKKFFFCDPMTNSASNSKYFNIFLKLKLPGINIFDWREESVKHNIQTDDFNCGIYIIYFCYQFVKYRKIFDEKTFEPNAYRQNLLSFTRFAPEM